MAADGSFWCSEKAFSEAFSAFLRGFCAYGDTSVAGGIQVRNRGSNAGGNLIEHQSRWWRWKRLEKPEFNKI